MADEVTTLSLAIDTRDAKEAATALASVVTAGEKAAAAFTVAESASRTAAAALAQEASAAQRSAAAKEQFLEALKDEVATYGKTKEAILQYRAAQAGAAAEAAPLIQQLQSIASAQEATAEAARKAADAQRAAEFADRQATAQREGFIAGLRDQVATLGLGRDALLEFRAAQLGVTAAATPLIAALKQQAQAQTKEAFVSDLQDQIAAYGKSANELLKLRAAQAGVTKEATPLIAKLQELARAHDEAAAAAAKEAEAERSAAIAEKQAASQRDAFISGLKEQIATFGLAKESLLEYRAAQLGVSAQSKSLIDSIRAQGASAWQNNFIASLEAESAAIGKTRAQLLELKAAQLGVADKAAPFITRIRESEKGLQKFAATGKLTGFQTAQMSAQLQDFFVQVQAGGSPLTALIQQGSQLSAVFGGFRPALAALTTTLLSATAGFLTLGASALGLAVAFAKGNSESAALQRSLALTGNAAGITEGKYNSMAVAIAEATNTSIGSTRDTLSGLIASGQISGQILDGAATAAQRLAKITGQSSEEIVKQFASAADSPTRFAESTNRAYNFLTAEQLKYIRVLEDQGRQQEALAVIFGALNQRLNEVGNNFGFVERAASAAGRGVSEFVDSLLALGRADTTETALAGVLKQIRELEDAGQKKYTLFGPSLDELYSQKRALEQTTDAENKQATAKEQNILKGRAQDAFNKEEEKYLNKKAQKLKEIAKLDALAAQGEIDPKRLAALKAQVAEKFKEAPVRTRGKKRDPQLEADLKAIQDSQNQQIAIYRGSEQILEAVRAAGITSESEYYDAKRAFIELNSKAQEQALTEQINRLKAEKATGDEAIRISQRIAEAESRLAIAKADSAAKNTVSIIQEQAAQEALARSYRESEIAATEAITAAKRTVRNDVQSIGIGDQERKQRDELEQIAEQYTRRQAALEAEYRNGRLRGNQELYEKEINLLIVTEGKELAIIEAGYAKRKAAEADYRKGVNESLANYITASENTARQVEDLFSNAFKGMENALVDFVKTGKLDFSSLADSIVADVTRIIVQQQLIKPLASFIGGNATGEGAFANILGSLFGGGRATGGPVQSGSLYEINETGKGPGEILNVAGRQYLLPSQNGSVQTNQAGVGGGMSVVNNFVISAPTDKRTQQQVAAAAGQGVQRALARNN